MDLKQLEALRAIAETGSFTLRYQEARKKLSTALTEPTTTKPYALTE